MKSVSLLMYLTFKPSFCFQHRSSLQKYAFQSQSDVSNFEHAKQFTGTVFMVAKFQNTDFIHISVVVRTAVECIMQKTKKKKNTFVKHLTSWTDRCGPHSWFEICLFGNTYSVTCHFKQDTESQFLCFSKMGVFRTSQVHIPLKLTPALLQVNYACFIPAIYSLKLSSYIHYMKERENSTCNYMLRKYFILRYWEQWRL